MFSNGDTNKGDHKPAGSVLNSFHMVSVTE